MQSRCALAALGAAAIVGLCGATEAGILVEYTFEVEITTGPLAGEHYFGDFSFFPPSGSFTELEDLNFVFQDKLFTEEDDADYPAFPRANFQEGNFVGIDYLVNIQGDGFIVMGFAIFNNEFTYLLSGGDGDPSYGGIVTYHLIPSAGTMALAGSIGLIALRRRRGEG